MVGSPDEFTIWMWAIPFVICVCLAIWCLVENASDYGWAAIILAGFSWLPVINMIILVALAAIGLVYGTARLFRKDTHD